MDYNSKTISRLNLDGTEETILVRQFSGSHIGKSMITIFEERCILALCQKDIGVFYIEEDFTLTKFLRTQIYGNDKFFDVLCMGKRGQFIAGVNNNIIQLYEVKINHTAKEKKLSFINFFRMKNSVLKDTGSFGFFSAYSKIGLIAANILTGMDLKGLMLLKFDLKRRKLQYMKVIFNNELESPITGSRLYGSCFKPITDNFLIYAGIHLSDKGEFRFFFIDVKRRKITLKDFKADLIGKNCSRLTLAGDEIFGVCQNAVVYKVKFFLPS